MGLEPVRIRRCANRCDFCFVDGLPDGLRDVLYIRDDDYRLSFRYGNFATLTNLKPRDIATFDALCNAMVPNPVTAAGRALRNQVAWSIA